MIEQQIAMLKQKIETLEKLKVSLIKRLNVLDILTIDVLQKQINQLKLILKELCANYTEGM